MGGKIKMKAIELLITVSSFRIKKKPHITEGSVTPLMNYKNR